MYDGQKIIETRNGSNVMVQQFIHGTQYIDELVMVRVKDKGEMYVHQDANWNVIGMTDMGRHVLEHNVLSPYGQLRVNQETGLGDRDGDQDVDSVDKGTVGTTCTGTVSGSCRILDLDFDGDYDSSDATLFDALPQGWQGREGLIASAVSQPFAHQGLLFEPEIGSYQNRRRQYDPGLRRFSQRDRVPLSFRQDNLYRYVRNNPLTLLDPSGKISIPWSVCFMANWIEKILERLRDDLDYLLDHAPPTQWEVGTNVWQDPQNPLNPVFDGPYDSSLIDGDGDGTPDGPALDMQEPPPPVCPGCKYLGPIITHGPDWLIWNPTDPLDQPTEEERKWICNDMGGKGGIIQGPTGSWSTYECQP